MKVLLTVRQALLKTVLVTALAILLNLANLFSQPSYAAAESQQLTSEEKLDRSYDGYGADAGVQEDIYQQRLKEGQDPEKMPKPYKRILDINKQKEVPETSLLETSISKTRALVDKVTNK